MQLITDHHDRIVDRLTRCSSRSWFVYKQNQPLAGSNKRPDLVLSHNSENAAIVIDVTCTFEDGPAAFDEARLEKTKKYLAGVSEEISIFEIQRGFN